MCRAPGLRRYLGHHRRFGRRRTRGPRRPARTLRGPAQRRRAEVPWAPLAHDVPPYGMTPLRYGLDHHRDRLSDSSPKSRDLHRRSGRAQTSVVQRTLAQPPSCTATRTSATSSTTRGARAFSTGVSSTSRRRCTMPVISSPWPCRLRPARARMRPAAGLSRGANGSRRGAHRLGRRLGGASAARALLRRRCMPGRDIPADAPPARQVFANAFLARVEAAISDLDSLDAFARGERRLSSGPEW